MVTAAAEWFMKLLITYTGIGIAFAILFVAVGVSRIDPVAKGAGLGFRLLILPGATALWPILLIRWMRESS